MARSVPEATIAIGRVRAMPFGRARAEAAARQARLIEVEGPDEVRAYALEALVEALTWNGQPKQALVAFIKLLRWWDRHPEHFDVGDQNILFWEFGWIVADMCRDPDIPADRVDRTLDDMERRFRLANRGLERVWFTRLDWELLRQGPKLDSTFTTWLTMPIDDEDSCVACHEEHHADYLLQKGDMAGAVTILEAALAADLSCSREPLGMMAMLSWCYVEQERLDDCEQLMVQALSEVRGSMSLSAMVAQARLFEVLGRGGSLERATGLLNKIADDMRVASPFLRLEVWRRLMVGAKCLVDLGYKETGINLIGIRSKTLGELVGEARGAALYLAEEFDTRHGNTVQEEAVERSWRTGKPTSRPLVVAPARPEPKPVWQPLSPARAGIEAEPTMREYAEQAFQLGMHEEAAVLYRKAANAFQLQGRLVDAGWCLAEAAHNAQQLGREDEAGRDYIEAQARLKAAGVTLEQIAPLFIAWAPGVQHSDYATFVRLALQDYPTPARPGDSEELEQILGHILQAGMVGSPLIRRYILARAELHDAVARVMATWGEPGDVTSALAMAQESASRLTMMGRTESAAHSWWLAGKIAARLNEGSADANYTLALQGFIATGEHNNRFASMVAQEYADYLAGNGRVGKATQVLAIGRRDY